MSKLLTAQEAGERLNVSASWMLAQARAGACPHVRLGKFVRFDADELEAWWRSKIQRPRSAA